MPDRPAPLAHSYVLRAEAAYNIGYRPAALADLTSALKISPHDAAATRRFFAWASGPERNSVALNLIAHDQDIATLRAAIKVLALIGQRRLAAVSVFDEYVAGWAAWDQDEAAELAIVSEDGALTSLLGPDPFHPLRRPTRAKDERQIPCQIAFPAKKRKPKIHRL